MEERSRPTTSPHPTCRRPWTDGRGPPGANEAGWSGLAARPHRPEDRGEGHRLAVLRPPLRFALVAGGELELGTAHAHRDRNHVPGTTGRAAVGGLRGHTTPIGIRDGRNA